MADTFHADTDHGDSVKSPIGNGKFVDNNHDGKNDDSSSKGKFDNTLAKTGDPTAAKSAAASNLVAKFGSSDNLKATIKNTGNAK